MYDIVIIGGGPAGMTAAIYARRNGRSVLLLEKEGFGGQIAYAPRVENYPGVAPVSGAELAERMMEQVLALDTETDIGTAVSVLIEDDRRVVLTEEGERYETRAVIIAAGARHRQLGLPNETALVGRGVSYCAVCDGSFYAGGTVAVVGGGDSALQEALLLSDICAQVYLIHRRETFRGDVTKQLRLFARDNVTVLTPKRVTELIAPEGDLTAVRLRDAVTGEETTLDVDALFVSVGQVPELDSFSDVLPLTAAGYAALGEGGESPAEGIFAAGDCRDKSVRQLATAVSDGACAAISACRYLEST